MKQKSPAAPETPAFGKPPTFGSKEWTDQVAAAKALVKQNAELEREKAEQETQALRDRRWTLIQSLVPEEAIKVIDLLRPEHCSIRCSDKDPACGFYTGRNRQVGCIRCALLEIVNGQAPIDFQTHIDFMAE